MAEDDEGEAPLPYGPAFGEGRPWVIAVGVDKDGELGAALVEAAGKVLFFDGPGMPKLRQAEYDAVVAVGTVSKVAHHLHVLQFGGSVADFWRHGRPNEPSNRMLGVAPGQMAQRFEVVAPATEVGRLVARSMLDALPRGGVYDTLRIPPDADAVALLREENGASVAAIVNREGASAGRCGSWTYLPAWTTERPDWLKLSLEYWRDQHPERFPHPAADWALEPDWMTAPERTAQEALDELEAAQQKLVADYEARRIELQESRDRARADADRGERRLLTVSGEALAAEAAAALSDLGFGVTDADGLAEHAAAKKEDLRVTDGAWTALAEVKGNAKRYAQTSVFLQIGSAVETYVQRNGTVPDARWYVVNQAHATPPSARARPFPDGPSDLRMFASRGGLVIDTRDLFRLRETVRAGDLTAIEARRLLKGATGVFEYPAPSDAPG